MSLSENSKSVEKFLGEVEVRKKVTREIAGRWESYSGDRGKVKKFYGCSGKVIRGKVIGKSV